MSMKGFLAFVLSCFFHFAESDTLQAQTSEDERRFIFDAVGIAINHTMLGGHDGLTYQLGFGIGAYHSGRKGKRFDILFGMEYNLNRLGLDYRYDGRWGHSRDLHFNIHAVSVPVFARLHLDRKQRFFVEGGAYIDFVVHATEQAERYRFDMGGLTSNVTSSKRRAAIRRFNYGPYAGIGCRLHIAGRPWLLKADASYGLSSIYEDMQSEMFLSYARIVAVMEF